MLTFKIAKNDKATKTITAAQMNSIYTKFNTYAKQKGATIQEKESAIGCMVWILPTGETLELIKVA